MVWRIMCMCMCKYTCVCVQHFHPSKYTEWLVRTPASCSKNPGFDSRPYGYSPGKFSVVSRRFLQVNRKMYFKISNGHIIPHKFVTSVQHPLRAAVKPSIDLIYGSLDQAARIPTRLEARTFRIQIRAVSCRKLQNSLWKPTGLLPIDTAGEPRG